MRRRCSSDVQVGPEGEAGRKETVEASEAGLEPKFETVPPDTVASPDSSAHAESDAAEMETQTAAKLEAQTQTDDLEL